MEAPFGEDLGRRGQQMFSGLLSPSFGGEGFDRHSCATGQHTRY